MPNEELVDLIAESIYKDLLDDCKDFSVPFYRLEEEAKNYYRHIAQNVMAVFDDYYDGEYDDAEDFDDDEDDLDWPQDL